jgi:hypothetical protein
MISTSFESAIADLSRFSEELQNRLVAHIL